MRQRAARKKRPKETPETLLEGLDHYSRYGRQHRSGGHSEERKQSIASKALGRYWTHLSVSLDVKNQSSGFPTRSNINRPVQSQKQARGLNSWLEKELY